MASMPPTDPGGPGGQTMINIVAYILQANGARAGSQPLTPQATATVRSASGAFDDRVRSGSSGRPARRRWKGASAPAPPVRKGLTVAGEVKNFVPVTDDDAAEAGSRRLADVPRQLSRRGATAR